MMRALSYLLALTLLAGCSLFADKDDSEPPAELVKLDAQVTLHKLWSHDLGVGTDEQFIRLVPAFFGDAIYAADRKGRVWALTADAGKELWEVKTEAAVSAAIGVGENVLLLGTSNAEVVALQLDDGSELWRSRVSSEVLSVPQVERGVVVVQTVDGKLTGLDVGDGSRKWVYDRSVPALTLRGTSTPVVGGGAVIAGFATGKLAALSVENGRVAWEVAVAVPRGRSELERMVDLDGDPKVYGNSIYAATFQGKLAGIDIPSGQVQWARDMSSFAGLGTDFSHVYVTDDQSDLWAVNRRNGATLWKQDALHLRGLSAPLGMDDYVIAGDFEGYVHVLSRFDGELLGRTRADSKGVATLTAVGDQLYVLGKGGSLTAYRIEASR